MQTLVDDLKATSKLPIQPITAIHITTTTKRNTQVLTRNLHGLNHLGVTQRKYQYRSASAYQVQGMKQNKETASNRHRSTTEGKETRTATRVTARRGGGRNCRGKTHAKKRTIRKKTEKKGSKYSQPKDLLLYVLAASKVSSSTLHT